MSLERSMRNRLNGHETRTKRRFRCPHCRTTERPERFTATSTTGIVLCILIALTIFGLLLCWIPLICCRDEHKRCSGCGVRLG